MSDAIANAVQLVMVNPTGASFQEDADDWAASSMDVGAFIDTIAMHANVVMADAVAEAVRAEREHIMAMLGPDARRDLAEALRREEKTNGR